MKILCTICARKGSKGLKNKNLLKINKNYNLIDYTLNQALKVKEINSIVVSSDISNLKKNKNKKIFYLNRSKNLSGDKIGKLNVIRNATIISEKFFKSKYDYVIDLDVTSPLRKIMILKKQLNYLKKRNLIILLHTVMLEKILILI